MHSPRSTVFTFPVHRFIFKHCIWYIGTCSVIPKLARCTFCLGVVRIVVFRHSARAVKGNNLVTMTPAPVRAFRIENRIREQVPRLVLNTIVLVHCFGGVFTRTQVVCYGNGQHSTVRAIALSSDIHHVYLERWQLTVQPVNYLVLPDKGCSVHSYYATNLTVLFKRSLTSSDTNTKPMLKYND